jgi:hypothetical protein
MRRISKNGLIYFSLPVLGKPQTGVLDEPEDLFGRADNSSQKASKSFYFARNIGTEPLHPWMSAPRASGTVELFA